MNRKCTLLVLILVLGLASCGDKNNDSVDSDEKVVLKIAAAANMQIAMDSIASVFLVHSGIECSVTTNSSGMLTAQIQNGAPYDVFVSANMRYPNELVKTGFGDSVQIYALGKLALIYKKGKSYNSAEEVLMDPANKRIALADKKTAPYGIAAKQYLKKSGIRSKIEEKIVIGESVGQVNQYIQTGAVDVAFTSYSFVRKFSKEHQFMEIDKKYYTEIKQGAILLKSGKENHPKEAEQFFDFLFSDDCQKILEYFGYTVI
ncbi:MAG: molybdate transport system substrate-binding protein [Crocinitomicaceae bacterium]|jgi:molybdate transport system substrate-binding protein